MKNYTELKWFEENLSLDTIPRGSNVLLYDISLGKDNPDTKYQELLSIFRKILSSRAGDFSDEEIWRKAFPDYFTSHFPSLSREECEELMANTPKNEWDRLPWDFGSWLEAIGNRGWRWLAHERKNSFLLVAIFLVEEVGNLEAFEELFRAAGCKVVRSESVTF